VICGVSVAGIALAHKASIGYGYQFGNNLKCKYLSQTELHITYLPIIYIYNKKSNGIVSVIFQTHNLRSCNTWRKISLQCTFWLPFQSVHSQETERLGGVTKDAPKPFHFRGGGGDLLVKLTGHHPGWTNTSGDQKVCTSPMPLKPFRNNPESGTVQPWAIRGNLVEQTN